METINIKSAASTITIQNNASSNSISNTARINSFGGQVNFTATGDGVAFNETIGSLSLEGTGWLRTDPRSGFNNTATVQSTLNLANGLSRGANNYGVMIASGAGDSSTDGGFSTAAGLNLTGHGIAADTAFIPWMFSISRYTTTFGGVGQGSTASARFMRTDSSGNLVANNATIGEADLTTWDAQGYGSTTDLAYEVTAANAMTGALDANAAVRSIAVGGNANQTTTLALGGNTLRADAIGLGAVTSTPSFVLGTGDANRGTVTANGTSGGDLYLIHHRTNSSAAGTFTVNSVLADNGGAVNVVFGGAAADFRVNTAATNTGKVFINASGSYGTGTVPTGGVTLGSSANFNTASEINFGGGGLMIMSSGNQTIGGSTAQTLSGGANLGAMGNIYAATRTLTIGANGVFSPGNPGANATFTLQFTTGKLDFAAGSELSFDLGAAGSSDRIAFIGGTAGDWLSGSGNATLNLTLGTGFDYGSTYTIFENVSTSGFTLAGISGYDTLNYTANFVQVGNNYNLSFSAIPEPSTYALLIGGASALFFLRRRKA